MSNELLGLDWTDFERAVEALAPKVPRGAPGI
jgi:hypothetical protein